jgi:hypothetical protein
MDYKKSVALYFSLFHFMKYMYSPTGFDQCVLSSGCLIAFIAKQNRSKETDATNCLIAFLITKVSSLKFVN